MALGKYNRRTVMADTGAVISGATVTFYNQLTGLPVTAYSDPDGLDPLGSSVESGENGEVEVFLPPGKYRITTELGSYSDEITYEPVVGDLAVIDATDVTNGLFLLDVPAETSFIRVLASGYSDLRTVVQFKTDLGLENVSNTSDANKPISTATQTALDLKADKSIAVSAGTGLTGGGDLSANRTLNVNLGTTAGTVAEGNHTHTNATVSDAGFMSAADKTKLDGIAAGAEVNQNTFTTISVAGQGDVVADTKTDTLTLVGVGVNIFTDSVTDTITFEATGVNPCASFVFDDAFSSQISLASQFESRGVRMGLAVNTFGGTGQMSQAQALALQSSGHEIINHGLNHLDMRDGTSVAFSSAVSEIDGYLSTLVSAGFNINGFACPYSSTKREFGPIIRKSHDYSFNSYMVGDYAGAVPSLGAISVPMPRHGLHRVSLYSHTLQQSKDIIDYCVANGRSVVFYDHDPSQVYHAASRTESEILEIVDYAINAGLSVVTPSQMLSTNTTIEGSNVFVCRPSSFSVPDSTFTTVFMSEAVEDANLSVDTSGVFTCKKTGMYRVLMNVEMTVSAEFRILSGMSFNSGSSIRYRRTTFATSRRPWDTDPITGNKFAGMAELDTAVWLVAGETFTLRVWQESGGSINTVAGAVESVYGWVLVSPCGLFV